LHTALSAQRAKTRARLRARTAANDNVVRLTAEPLELTAEYVVPEAAEEAPFLPPPVDDIFGMAECEDEEETIFAADLPPLKIEAEASEAAEEIVTEAEVEAEEIIEDDAPFDPPEFEAEPVFSAPALIAEPIAPPPKPAPKPAPSAAPRDRPLPAISVQMSWDRPEAEALMRELAADPRLARAEIEIRRGGIGGATERNADLFVLDSDLDNAAMLAALDRLRAHAPQACIVMLGAVNDIALLRDLAARGVRDYVVLPAKAGDIARSLCALFADVAPAQVIAVIGARGGVGASTIARNVAWSIAERQQRKTTLVDLDLSFGLAGASFGHEPALSVLDVVAADDSEQVLMQALSDQTERLSLLSAPGKTESLELDPSAFAELLANTRRTSSHVVLDLPHAWEPWIRHALREADEVVVVAGPDLASLRNADNMLKLLRSERDKPSTPMVVLSMTGVPKRPEIPLKDYAQALCVQPEICFAFEPELFGKAEADGHMIYEAMPDSKAALQLDALATSLTGHEPIAKPAPRERRKPEAAKAETAPEKSFDDMAEAETAPAQPLPVLELTTQAPPIAPQPRRRRVARTGFVALQEPPPRKRRRSSGFVRTALAAIALVLTGAWFEVQQAAKAGAHPAPTLSFRV
jgi:pilus assembly protein CpaE